MFEINNYGYDLPDNLIAQTPSQKRDESRMLVFNRQNKNIAHRLFYELPELLSESDVLVVNNTKVFPARLMGKKDTGGKAEVLILNYSECFSNDEQGYQTCKCLLKASKHPPEGSLIHFDFGLKAKVVKEDNNGIFTLQFLFDGILEDILEQIGKIPLPPYIRRNEENLFNDQQSYQTIYASEKGAIAAPTAGFHFTDALINKLKNKGVNIIEITLHVGYGTFIPVRENDIRNHKIHSEEYIISKKVSEYINNAKEKGSRIIAVGTTTVRTLEYMADENGYLKHGKGTCDIFIYPSYKFKIVDAMITNFHLPKSTLLMLVSAFAGRETILYAYSEAIKQNYRFFSYGDAMLIF
ncbi:MAG: tRNA preQ1(34) S-adenosylmethionine ribosyltransferase-isomerase QueA [Desulfobacterales bacterium]|nr:tRNA preQ1(34) S-adenosylmethionine ribosyltransferase-isomerase QueA [Desulfobacterales bacterium]